ncbi:MAG: hypothetical protein WEB57_08880 [Pseudohongiellaceae bacterium]
MKLTMAALLTLTLAACAGLGQPHPLVGEWDATISTPMGAMSADLIVNEDMTGEMRSSELGSTTLNNVTVDGEQVSFSTTVDAQGMMLTLDFDGTVEDDTLEGSFDTEFGAIGVTGTRR